MNIPRKCRGCGAAIVFVKTPGGKAMPCDDAPLTYRTAQDGEIIITPNGDAVHGVAVAPGTAGATGWGYRPHWATCPDVVKFRKAVTAPAEQITMEQLAKAKQKGC